MTNKSFSFNEATTIQGLSTQSVGMLGGVFMVSQTLILPPTSSSNERYFSLYLAPGSTCTRATIPAQRDASEGCVNSRVNGKLKTVTEALAQRLKPGFSRSSMEALEQQRHHGAGCRAAEAGSAHELSGHTAALWPEPVTPGPGWAPLGCSPFLSCLIKK